MNYEYVSENIIICKNFLPDPMLQKIKIDLLNILDLYFRILLYLITIVYIFKICYLFILYIKTKTFLSNEFLFTNRTFNFIF